MEDVVEEETEDYEGLGIFTLKDFGKDGNTPTFVNDIGSGEL